MGLRSPSKKLRLRMGCPEGKQREKGSGDKSLEAKSKRAENHFPQHCNKARSKASVLLRPCTTKTSQEPDAPLSGPFAS